MTKTLNELREEIHGLNKQIKGIRYWVVVKPKGGKIYYIRTTTYSKHKANKLKASIKKREHKHSQVKIIDAYKLLLKK